MTLVLGTLCLNEIEFLPALVAQHLSWPELVRWVFVEACDVVYAKANPTQVSAAGLSVDGTTEFLRDLAGREPRVTYIPHGFTSHADAAVGKAAAKDRYLEVANGVGPDWVINLDADEFVARADQGRMLDVMRSRPRADAFVFHRREVWRPPACTAEPLFSREVVGGFWAIPCAHWWRWTPGMRFADCHNTPSYSDGSSYNDSLCRYDGISLSPCMIHLGFAASQKTRLAKHRYYGQRGEKADPKRKWYVQSRAAWFDWRPDRPSVLPRDARVIAWQGSIPEVFR